MTSVNILRLISELEGSYQLTKYMGFKEDMDTLEEIKKRYYKMYFKLSKEENKGIGSVGRAPALQAGCHRFESVILHSV